MCEYDPRIEKFTLMSWAPTESFDIFIRCKIRIQFFLIAQTSLIQASCELKRSKHRTSSSTNTLILWIDYEQFYIPFFLSTTILLINNSPTRFVAFIKHISWRNSLRKEIFEAWAWVKLKHKLCFIYIYGYIDETRYDVICICVCSLLI